MKLIANRQLTGTYGTVAPGQAFEAPEDVAIDLMKRDLARRAEPPTVVYETKPAHFETPLVVPEVTARLPFRDVPVSDSEPEELVTAGDSVLPETDVPKQGVADPGRRRGRKRLGAE